MTDKHHKTCPHYDDMVKVVVITVEGHGSYCDTDITGALTALAEGDNGCFQVEIKDMLQREIDAMPEFQGF